MGNTLLSAVVFVDDYFLGLPCYQAPAKHTKPSRLFLILSYFWHLAKQVFQLFLEALECLICLFQLCGCEFSNPGLDEFHINYFNIAPLLADVFPLTSILAQSGKEIPVVTCWQSTPEVW